LAIIGLAFNAIAIRQFRRIIRRPHVMRDPNLTGVVGLIVGGIVKLTFGECIATG
jgi:hypothetical protein